MCIGESMSAGIEDPCEAFSLGEYNVMVLIACLPPIPMPPERLPLYLCPLQGYPYPCAPLQGYPLYLCPPSRLPP